MAADLFSIRRPIGPRYVAGRNQSKRNPFLFVHHKPEIVLFLAAAAGIAEDRDSQ